MAFSKKKTRANSDYVIVASYRMLAYVATFPKALEDSRLSRELFIHESAKSIFDAIKNLVKRNESITQDSLFQEANKIDYNISQEVVAKALSYQSTISEQSFEGLLGILLKRSQKFTLARILAKTVNELNTHEDLDISTVNETVYEINRIIKDGYKIESKLKDIDTWTDEYIEELDLRKSGVKYSYGDLLLDRYILKGAYPGAITTLIAGTSQGKSTYALNIINGLINLGIPCIYISLEMGAVDTYDRLVCLRKEIPIEFMFQSGNEMQKIIDMVKLEKESIKENKKFYFVDCPILSVLDVQNIIHEFKAKTGAEYAIVFIDLVTQLQDFMSSKSSFSVANQYEKAMNMLHEVSRAEGVHIVSIAQQNRSTDNIKIDSLNEINKFRPTLNSVKNSGALAERSRVLISLFRPKFYAERYFPDEPETELMEDIVFVDILKNSSGPPAHLTYLFEGSVFKMEPHIVTTNSNEEEDDDA